MYNLLNAIKNLKKREYCTGEARVDPFGAQLVPQTKNGRNILTRKTCLETWDSCPLLFQMCEPSRCHVENKPSFKRCNNRVFILLALGVGQKQLVINYIGRTQIIIYSIDRIFG